MDLLIAVAISLLPVSRLKVAAVLQELRQSGYTITLELMLDALKVAAEQRSTVAAESRQAAAAALAEAQRLRLEVVTWFDTRYPPLLACIPDPPPVLWVKGTLETLARPAVAIVGSRAATPYALQVGRRLAWELAERGVVVVSGLARGVDSSAHEGCLAAGGETIAVLGSGLDRVYPLEHASLSEQISQKGLVISELAPGSPPIPGNFPLRNRIISGISFGTVVVEASESSGSLITAACALRQGRDVMAVPGSVLSGRNKGSHALLKDGARVVETAADILDELGWGAGGSTGTESKGTPDPLVAKMQPGESYSFDQLVELSGVVPAKLLTRLMELELLGQVQSIPGGRFTRPSVS
jgi:DNA processing protein